jgi:DNA-binding transcriptional ArsR family regulator
MGPGIDNPDSLRYNISILAITNILWALAMDDVVEVADTLKILSDPTRLRLIRLLGQNQGSLCVNALAHRLGVTQSAVSQHLRVLRAAGLVQGDRQGYRVHYSLNAARVAQVKEILSGALGEDI